MEQELKRLLKPIFHPKKAISVSVGKEPNEVYFCAAGEWGYEIMSWIPYLNFLKNQTGLHLNTISRPGSKVFYPFSDKHLEVLPEEISDVWGRQACYKKIKQRLGLKTVIYVCNEYMRGGLDLTVNNVEWATKDIHARIEERNFLMPRYSGANAKLPFNFGKPFVIINNKFAKEWGDAPPVNFHSREELIALRDSLRKMGYAIVYNRFIEKTADDVFYNTLNDTGIFVENDCYDLRDFYRKTAEIDEWNKVQLAAYDAAAFVIAVQGGNVYLPALRGKKIYMTMKKGDYIDYTELPRILGIPSIEVYYETRQLIESIETHEKHHA